MKKLYIFLKRSLGLTYHKIYYGNLHNDGILLVHFHVWKTATVKDIAGMRIFVSDKIYINFPIFLDSRNVMYTSIYHHMNGFLKVPRRYESKTNCNLTYVPRGTCVTFEGCLSPHSGNLSRSWLTFCSLVTVWVYCRFLVWYSPRSRRFLVWNYYFYISYQYSIINM